MHNVTNLLFRCKLPNTQTACQKALNISAIRKVHGNTGLVQHVGFSVGISTRLLMAGLLDIYSLIEIYKSEVTRGVKRLFIFPDHADTIMIKDIYQ